MKVSSSPEEKKHRQFTVVVLVIETLSVTTLTWVLEVVTNEVEVLVTLETCVMVKVTVAVATFVTQLVNEIVVTSILVAIATDVVNTVSTSG
jgi:hypothetical protein